jgi:hypothetical protein
VDNWIGWTVDANALANDLRALQHVDMKGANDPPYDNAARLAEKLRCVVSQVNSGFEHMLTTLAKVWYEKSLAAGTTNPLPSQVACHSVGDAAVDLYLKAILTLKTNLADFPTNYTNLPAFWQAAIPPTTNLAAIHRSFTNERFRVEHLINVSSHGITTARHPLYGLDAQTTAATRNVVFSSQPAILALDGQGSRVSASPPEQELWDIPHTNGFWRNLLALPRYDHHEPLPMYADYDIPFTINTDPPSVPDPRPALTLIGAVARSPIEIDPAEWLDQTGANDPYPRDYLVGRVYAPLGFDNSTGTNRNPMQLTVEQALCAMTFWAAYAAGLERELGAIAGPQSTTNQSAWFADLVVWENNPLAIGATTNSTLEQLARTPGGIAQAQKVDAVNNFIRKFRPALTIVSGVPVYALSPGDPKWQGLFAPAGH